MNYLEQILIHYTINYIVYFFPDDSQLNTAAAIAVPLLLIIIIMILLIIAIIAMVEYFKRAKKLNIRVSFTVEDKPGSLARALKVFKVWVPFSIFNFKYDDAVCPRIGHMLT